MAKSNIPKFSACYVSVALTDLDIRLLGKYNMHYIKSRLITHTRLICSSTVGEHHEKVMLGEFKAVTRLTEEILTLICERQEMAIREIMHHFSLEDEILTAELGFLVKFGFVRLDKSQQFARLTDRSKSYVREDSLI